MSLSAGGTGTALPDIVTAQGPTGSATAIPVITIDAKGRVTALTTTGAGDAHDLWATRLRTASATTEGFVISAGGTTYFIGPWQDREPGATENQFELSIMRTLTVSKLTVYVPTNTLDTAGARVTLRNNGLDQAISVAVDTGAGTLSSTGSVVFSPGDKMTFKLFPPATGTGSATLKGIIIDLEFTPA